MEDATFDSRQNEKIVNCDEHTRQEMLEDIIQWTESPIPDEHLYWLQGKAGTGKSTIARTVADKLDKKGRLAASFFFQRDKDHRSSADYFFPTIAAQLAQRIPGVAPHIQSAVEAEPRISTMMLRLQFERLILEPMKAVSHPNSKAMTVVIDALDECKKNQDIEMIIDLLLQIDSLVIPLKFFVTSRLESSVRLAFQDAQEKKVKQFPLHAIREDIIKQDIAIFLEPRLAKIQRHPKGDSSWPDKDTFQMLLEKSIPLFIFAATACRFINDTRISGGPDERLQMILQNETPADLDGTYLLILEQTIQGLKASLCRNEIKNFKTIVGSIATLANPLDAAALARLLNIGTGYVNDKLNLLHSVLDIPNDANGPVRIFHDSFRDFLINPEDTHKFSVDEKATHEMLAERCLLLLSSSGHLKQNIYGLAAPGSICPIPDQKKLELCLPSEIQYACVYWVYHLKKSGVILNDEHRARPFLLDHFLHWLEALSLMGMISESIKLLNDLQSLVDVSQ